MAVMSRRNFLKTGAAATAATMAAPVLSRGWYGLSGAEAPGYFEREFGVSDGLCRKVLAEALSRGGDYADLFFEHTITNYLVLEDGQVNRAMCDVALGAGIRTVKDDQVGYGFTQDLGEKAMLAAAATAATIASAKPKGPAGKFVPLEKGDYYPLDILLSSVPLESKLPLVKAVNEKCFALSPLVTKVNVVFYDEQKRILVVTSDGVKAEDLLPRTYLNVGVVAEKDGRRERSGWNIGGRREFSFYTPAVADRLAKCAVDRAVFLFEAIQPPAGEMPVVLGPGITGVLLHEAVGHGMEADFNRKKTSTYSTMIGKKVAEPFVTIIDDATVPNLLGSINVDDEGTPGQKNRSRRQGHPGELHARQDLRQVLRRETHGKRPPAKLPALCHPAHAEHLHARRAGDARRRHQGRGQGHLRRGCQQWTGEDRRRRFRLLCLPGQVDRKREAGRSHQGREHHGKRSQDAGQYHHAGG